MNHPLSIHDALTTLPWPIYYDPNWPISPPTQQQTNDPTQNTTQHWQQLINYHHNHPPTGPWGTNTNDHQTLQYHRDTNTIQALHHTSKQDHYQAQQHYNEAHWAHKQLQALPPTTSPIKSTDNPPYWQIWQEGHPGTIQPHHYIGTAQAPTFQQAIHNWYQEHPTPGYNETTQTTIGAHHYPTKQLAQQRHG